MIKSYLVVPDEVSAADFRKVVELNVSYKPAIVWAPHQLKDVFGADVVLAPLDGFNLYRRGKPGNYEMEMAVCNARRTR